jgi:gamma-glutamyl phosphate reductase
MCDLAISIQKIDRKGKVGFDGFVMAKMLFLGTKHLSLYYRYRSASAKRKRK